MNIYNSYNESVDLWCNKLVLPKLPDKILYFPVLIKVAKRYQTAFRAVSLASILQRN